VANGWHPWYEIKADPEDPQRLIICGTKWDASDNAFVGFVFSSSDGAATWREVLNDRNSSWVTEHSCAFGPHHLAYFISEASKVVDGDTHHELGTTRLYLSRDGGQHWLTTFKTEWADHSTSAVSSASGNLYTFFNTGENTAKLTKPMTPNGTTIGLLVFSADGKDVKGPFFDHSMLEKGYHGSFPSQALALKSGAVVALYQGLPRPPGTESEFGIIRATPSSKPLLESIVISHTAITTECPLVDRGSLAYDSARDRLFLLYGDGCKNRQLMLTSSDDGGKTWTKPVPVISSSDLPRIVYCPSLLLDARGRLILLWRDSQVLGNWFVSQIRNQQLVEPATEFPANRTKRHFKNDSLWTLIFQPNSHHGSGHDSGSEALLTLNVANMEDRVWRTNGLVAAGNRVITVWSSAEDKGDRLFSGVLVNANTSPDVDSSPQRKRSNISDLTNQTRLLYGGTQQFDDSTGVLKVCLIVANRGDSPMRAPVRIEATSVSSPLGAVSILSVSNGLTGPGAIWDISDSMTAGELVPEANSKPFCLFFHLEIPPERTAKSEDANLLTVRMRVLAGQ